MALKQVTQKDRIIAKLKAIHKELGRALMEYDALTATEEPRPDPKKLILINPLTNKPMPNSLARAQSLKPRKKGGAR